MRLCPKHWKLECTDSCLLKKDEDPWKPATWPEQENISDLQSVVAGLARINKSLAKENKERKAFAILQMFRTEPRTREEDRENARIKLKNAIREIEGDQTQLQKSIDELSIDEPGAHIRSGPLVRLGIMPEPKTTENPRENPQELLDRQIQLQLRKQFQDETLKLYRDNYDKEYSLTWLPGHEKYHYDEEYSLMGLPGYKKLSPFLTLWANPEYEFWFQRC
ncbi:hypothetical protein EAF04_003361 [Stromatinia cepivora]|nr:hypothetical protein EAF04_003361 [Stromatinia cepivora]